jgi:small subunit ribosomal protein S3Ae
MMRKHPSHTGGTPSHPAPPSLSLFCASLFDGFVLSGYTLRLFCIAFTTKMPGQMKKTCYAQAGQVRVIRKKMVDIMTEEASSEDLKGLIQKL